ncbi:aromatic compound dioxygenase [Cutaneotrichosporon oleaginosum]|uniref:Aromatic compound dioxygenase n=2 Tax=Cutaneotrichosporon oleaginosum TaxID=879819 RepID=A0A0J0XXE0_9TREE|nr:aromatic compound dioxygenase [Cutaneotrichosporon oleaginosum]KLT45721.1 aromatic compound dioxygenase [Cutaneotrichosporon oleaginosum]
MVEADISTEELLAACDMLVGAGKVSDERRNEVLLMSDTFGCESLCDMLDAERADRANKAAKSTGAAAGAIAASAIIGPFYRTGVPEQPNGTSIVRHPEPNAPYTYMHGTIYGADGAPLPDALVDIWHDAPDGLYDAQTPHKPEYHCRGRFRTDAQGRWAAVILKPTPYPIPYDHQAGAILQMMDRHPNRPAHVHLWIHHPEHRSFVTQIFNADSEYLKDDAVFAVKDELVVEYKPISKDYKQPEGLDGEVVWELQQDFRLPAAA